MTATDPTRHITPGSFAPGGYDGPPLPDPLPATHGEPVLDPITGEREPIRYVPAGNQMIPMTATQIADLVRLHQQPRTEPEPQRGVDRVAQRLVAGGACAVGVGYGTSLALNAAAGFSTGAAIALAAAVIACKAAPAMGKKVTNNITNTTTVNATNSSKWFGRSTTSTTTNTSK